MLIALRDGAWASINGFIHQLPGCVGFKVFSIKVPKRGMKQRCKLLAPMALTVFSRFIMQDIPRLDEEK